MASDCTDGSSSVQISGQEVMLKNQSYFKTSTGDEAGAAPMKGVITSTNTGKVYFNAWSMDVQVEGENVVRNLDLTTHNHASVPGNTPPWPYMDEIAAPGVTKACEKDLQKEQDACKGVAEPEPCKGVGMDKPPQTDRDITKPIADRMAHLVVCNDCLNARRCRLSPYGKNAKDDKGEKIEKKCCPGQTPHHIVEKASFKGMGGGYDPDLAPCVCAEGVGHSMGGTHELMHVFQKASTLATLNASPSAPITYGQARDNGLNAFQQVFPDAGCDPDCIKKQLDSYHNQCGITDTTPVSAVTPGPSEETMSVEQAQKDIAMRSWNRNQLPAAYRV
jgi:hypothetical protein